MIEIGDGWLGAAILWGLFRWFRFWFRWCGSKGVNVMVETHKNREVDWTLSRKKPGRLSQFSNPKIPKNGLECAVGQSLCNWIWLSR